MFKYISFSFIRLPVYLFLLYYYFNLAPPCLPPFLVLLWATIHMAHKEAAADPSTCYDSTLNKCRHDPNKF